MVQVLCLPYNVFYVLFCLIEPSVLPISWSHHGVLLMITPTECMILGCYYQTHIIIIIIIIIMSYNLVA
jgi:hypothetical protein